MRNRDKFLGIIAILAIIGLLFAGCGGSGGDSTTPGGTDDPNTPGGSSGGGGGGAYVGGGSKPSTPQNTGTADSVSVAFAQDSISLITNDTATVGALVTTTGAALDLVVYSTSDAAVADVDTFDGEITAEGPGTATITIQSAWDNKKTDTLTVTVLDSIPAGKGVTAITLDKTGVVGLTAGQKLPVKVTFEPPDAAQQGITWTPLAAASAAVEVENGIATAVKAGTATVTATSINGSKTASFDVVVSAAAPTGVSITNAVADLTIFDDDGTLQMTKAVEPSGAVQDVLWSSASPAVATINASGLLTVKGTGTTEITVTTVAEPVKTASVTVTVEREITGVTITGVDQDDQAVNSPASITMEDTIQLSAVVAPATASGAFEAADQTVVWTIPVTGEEFIAVSADGLVTPVKVGGPVTVTATAIDGTTTSTFSVEVEAIAVTSLTLDPTAPAAPISPVEGTNIPLPTVEILPENSTDQTYEWTSSDDDIIEVTRAGTGTAEDPYTYTAAVKAGSAGTGISASLICTPTDTTGGASAKTYVVFTNVTITAPPAGP